MFFVASRKHLSSQKHLCFIYPIYLSCLSCTTTCFLAQQSKSETFVLVLEPTPTLPARHFVQCLSSPWRLWHSTSFWTWSPRWSATTPCASWVSGIPKKGSLLAVLWLLKKEDVLMKIDGLIIIYCYALTVTIVWVQPLWKANLHAHSRASRPIWHLHPWRSDIESEEDEANRAREAEDEKTRQIEDSDSTKKWDDRQGGHLHFRISLWYWMYNM